MKHNDCKSADYCLEKMTDISPVYCCYLTMLNIPKANPPTPSATSNPSIHYALQRIILTCERIFMKQNYILYVILFQSRGKIAPAFGRQGTVWPKEEVENFVLLRKLGCMRQIFGFSFEFPK